MLGGSQGAREAQGRGRARGASVPRACAGDPAPEHRHQLAGPPAAWRLLLPLSSYLARLPRQAVGRTPLRFSPGLPALGSVPRLGQGVGLRIRPSSAQRPDGQTGAEGVRPPVPGCRSGSISFARGCPLLGAQRLLRAGLLGPVPPPRPPGAGRIPLVASGSCKAIGLKIRKEVNEEVTPSIKK